LVDEVPIGLGQLDIRDEALDGELMVGLAPAVPSINPGAEVAIFPPGESGALWTKVRISGTVGDPEEPPGGNGPQRTRCL
jgi:hypothetical protein